MRLATVPEEVWILYHISFGRIKRIYKIQEEQL